MTAAALRPRPARRLPPSNQPGEIRSRCPHPPRGICRRRSHVRPPPCHELQPPLQHVAACNSSGDEKHRPVTDLCTGTSADGCTRRSLTSRHDQPSTGQRGASGLCAASWSSTLLRKLQPPALPCSRRRSRRVAPSHHGKKIQYAKPELHFFLAIPSRSAASIMKESI